MNSKAKIAGHPIHPMLVAFPIGLYGATIAALLAFVATHDSFFFRAAMTANIAGVAMALIAAVPGFIYFFGLPRGSRVRTVGLQHAAANLTALALFAVSASLLYTRWSHREVIDGALALDAALPLGFGLLGLVSTVIAGGLGWSLVQTHHVGVKPKYEPFHAVSPRAVTRDEEDDDDIVQSPTYTTSGWHSTAHH